MPSSATTMAIILVPTAEMVTLAPIMARAILVSAMTTTLALVKETIMVTEIAAIITTTKTTAVALEMAI